MNMKPIMAQIQEQDPDVIMFVEYAPQHHKFFYEKLKSTYPYINRTYPEYTVIGKVVMSKYPMKDIDLVENRSVNYTAMTLTLPRGEHDLYLVHMSSPVSNYYFERRNSQLEQIATEIQKKFIEDPKTQVTIAGDFNVAPRTFNYQKMENIRAPYVMNITRYINDPYTWKMHELPAVTSHIDHVRTNHDTQVISVEQQSIEGSDHQLIFREYRNYTKQ